MIDCSVILHLRVLGRLQYLFLVNNDCPSLCVHETLMHPRLHCQLFAAFCKPGRFHQTVPNRIFPNDGRNDCQSLFKGLLAYLLGTCLHVSLLFICMPSRECVGVLRVGSCIWSIRIGSSFFTWSSCPCTCIINIRVTKEGLCNVTNGWTRCSSSLYTTRWWRVDHEVGWGGQRGRDGRAGASEFSMLAISLTYERACVAEHKEG